MTCTYTNLDVPLTAAVIENDIELVSVLLKQGAGVSSKDFLSGYTPLHRAAGNGNKKIALALIEHGANPNAIANYGWTPLHMAVVFRSLHGNNEIVSTLIEHGADLNARDDDGTTPLYTIISNQNSYESLFKFDSSVIQPSVQEKIFRASLSQHLENKLPQEFIDNFYDNLNKLLRDAIKNSDIELVSKLIEQGADINSKDFLSGYTPLHRAAENGNKEIALALIEHGADLNAIANYGWTPLHMAVIFGSLRGNNEIAPTLIEHGANLNAKDDDGTTPLYIIISNQNSFESLFKFDSSVIAPSVREKLFCASLSQHLESNLPQEFVDNFIANEAGGFINSYTDSSFTCLFEVEVAA